VNGERGQAGLLLLGVLLAALVGAFVLGGLARGVGAHGAQQRAADLAALAGAKAMHVAYPRLFEREGGLSVAAYLDLGRRTALDVARRNGADAATVRFPDAEAFAPVRIAVAVERHAEIAGRRTTLRARAEAELAPPATLPELAREGDEYRGPLAHRQGQPMRPDVAQAFDRMEAAARRAGVALVVTSGFRSNAEQAALFAQRPDPKWVAPPGRSLHRLGTELDLGPPAAYAWLAANARRFGFVQRYSWEPWHYGYTRSAGTRSVGFGPPDGRSGLPSFVPPRFAPAISRAAQRWNVGAALLAAQLYAESNFNPFARSPAGAQGIAQFMPATARAYGLRNPFDADQAIDAQAHLMHDLLRQFAAVPLALAAYNAGPAPVQRCGCIPPYPETRGYVARILGLLGGAGDAPPGGGLDVRLVR
jgi:soluble lytic murein transglycosylase-like protein